MLHIAICFLVLGVISSSPVQNETWETNEQLSKGPYCGEPGCLGWPENCMGNGVCDAVKGECTCDEGWKGNACDIPDCDCNGINATCEKRAGDAKPRCYDCDSPFIGDKCQYRCIYGEEDPETYECTCDACYTGEECNLLCNNQGTCNNGTCDCGFGGYSGKYCHIEGCPGYNESCSGHGTCNDTTGNCTCSSGWIGIECHIAYCENDCSNAGTCLELDTPTCECNTSYFGIDCGSYCDNGVIVTPDPDDLSTPYCQCDDCYSGFDCDVECSGHGNCTNGLCDCGLGGWRGNTCETAGCPILNGKDCNGHGSCVFGSNTETGECQCNRGWSGDGCWTAECPGNCSGRGTCLDTAEVPYCINCSKGWTGDDCNTQEPMDSGLICSTQCNGHGVCDALGNCLCAVHLGYKGQYCDEPVCPGWPENCMANGVCDVVTGECACDQGWKGNACDIPDCDCNGMNATCEQRAGDDKPRCYDCGSPFFGDKCQFRCVSGGVDQDTFECVCDACYSGETCNLLCNNQGACNDGTCDCGFDGYRGEYCHIEGCPGYNESCSGHGTCDDTRLCTCNPGWIGIGCHVAKCQNNCSNAGTCLDLDTPRCKCNASYFGIDCGSYCDNGVIVTPDPDDLSIQYCQCDGCYSGFECDVECSGHGHCINGLCDCGLGGWRGDTCERAGCPGPNGEDCSGHGSCVLGSDTEIGTCDCGFDGYRGEYCHIKGCPGYNESCSGHGTCNDTGLCTCNPGWIGIGCHIAKCRNDCSNAGICLELDTPRCECNASYFRIDCGSYCDNGVIITPDPDDHSTQYCQCDYCYSGFDCDVECSGHGNCTNGLCDCGLGGWRGDTCERAGCPGLNGEDCSGHGSCILGSGTEIGTCDCGFDGYRGEYCHIKGCPGYNESCSGHGTCNDTGLCTCNPGWIGIGCRIAKCRNDCSNAGICLELDTPRCECNASYFRIDCGSYCDNGVIITPDPDDHSTQYCQCDYCYSGFDCDVECSGHGNCTNGLCDCGLGGWRGDTCERAGCPGLNGEDCSGHGSCILGSGTEIGTCDCGFDGYRGEYCHIKGCPGYNESCSGHGTCNDTGLCTCNPGWIGIGCHIAKCRNDCSNAGICLELDTPRCECNVSYFRIDCGSYCDNGVIITPDPDDHSTQYCQCDYCYSGFDCDVECSGHGNCTNGLCDCGLGGWKGDTCERAGCPGLNGEDCSGHGSCILGSDTEIGTCDCGFDGYRGEYCHIKGCPGYNESCSGHGTCNDTGLCTCNPGWIGIGCHIAKCRNDCSNAGICLELDTPRCECNVSYFRIDCGSYCDNGVIITPDPDDHSTQYCQCDYCYSGFDCDVECSGHGNCTNGLCDCGLGGWRGDTCERAGCPGLNGEDCSGHGSCVLGSDTEIGTCDCGFDGYRGEYCHIEGCPGYNESCSGHGTCDDTGLCTCNPGWVGIGCHIAKCQNDCSNAGICLELDTPRCECNAGYFRIDCGSYCDNGVIVTPDPYDHSIQYCQCDGCYSGFECDVECSGHGHCTNDLCDCGLGGWRGDTCERACPGLNGEDCSGHGSCVLGSDTEIGECYCNQGWVGDGCWTAECPGNCSGRGTCLDTEEVPYCINCSHGWSGDDCNTLEHEPMDLGLEYEDITKRAKERQTPRPQFADDMLQDVWKRSIKEQNSSNICTCQAYNCSCCLYLEIDAIKLNDTVCTNFTYLPMPDYDIEVTLSVGNDTIINETMSARNPAPLCEDVPDLEESANLCFRFKNLKFQQYSLSGCVRVEARLNTTVVEEDGLGCFRILPKSQTHSSQQQANGESQKN